MRGREGRGLLLRDYGESHHTAAVKHILPLSHNGAMCRKERFEFWKYQLEMKVFQQSKGNHQLRLNEVLSSPSLNKVTCFEPKKPAA